MLAAALALAGLLGAEAAPTALRPAAGKKPHIIMHLADDFGWANAGWHRMPGYAEVQTPAMDKLVKTGIELDHAYSYKFCSPTRSCLQSGRLPVHVNVLNLGPEVFNPTDPVSGFAAIPRNMTGMATKLKAAGYSTHQVGKWDAGMATTDHTPHGRGYDTAFGYFHHANDYWTEHVGVYTDLYNETEATTWHGAGPAYAPTDGPGYGLNGSTPDCEVYAEGQCGMTGPEEDYEEFKFKNRVLEVINGHDANIPLFLCYTSHIVHEPLEVPKPTWDKFDFIGTSQVGDFEHHRQTYHAMVYYMDTVVGSMVAALQAKEMWSDTLWFFQSDNGGPSFTGSSHTANNYPQKGSKMTNWQGGIRVNAFVSGGMLSTAAPAMVGTKLDGFTHACDFYATFCALAGVDKTDARAAAAGLPPVDGLDLWPYLSGKVKASPRTEVFADSVPFGVLLMEHEGKKWKLMYATPGGPDRSLNVFKDSLLVTDGSAAELQAIHRGTPPPDPEENNGTKVPVACWMGPQYPNATVNPGCNSTVYCPDGCLYDIDADPWEHAQVAAANPGPLAALKARLEALQPTFFDPDRTSGGSTARADNAAVARGGYWGPFVFP
jgi:arylsulfatase I/J